MFWIPAFAGMTIITMAIVAPMIVFAYQFPGTPKGFVNDFAGVLSNEQRQALEAKLQTFEQSSSNEIAVATIQSLGGDTIENFAEKLFKEWGIGKKKQDNGVLILIAKDDRKMRIEVGYGLEGALTDAQSFAIIDRVMRPAFRANDFYGGIDAAVDAIIATTKGEYVAPQEPSASAVFLSSVAPLLFQLFILIAGVWLTKVLGKSESWWAGGVIGGGVGIAIGLLQGALIFGIFSTIFFVIFGLIFDYSVSRSYQRFKDKDKAHTPWWFGGSSGWGSGGSGGGGGFGGGSSGGGGASGGW